MYQNIKLKLISISMVSAIIFLTFAGTSGAFEAIIKISVEDPVTQNTTCNYNKDFIH
jgi:hypothetical protein